MDDAPRSNRPTPRTAAAAEAELRRRIRAEMTQARQDADGELDDASLAGIIARAVASALSWHLEAPEHARNATLSSRTWRGAGGPRAGGGPRERGGREPYAPPPDEPFQERGPRPFEPRGGPRPFDPRGPRPFDRPRREFDPDRSPRGRDVDPGFSAPRGGGRGGPPRRPPPGGPRGGGGGGRRPGPGGGFGPRRPRRPG